MNSLSIHEDIRQAETLPGSFYTDPNAWAILNEKIWPHYWHYLADASVVAKPGDVHPINLLPGILDEPLLLTHDRTGQVNCMSNVCTHRGNIIVEEPGNQRILSCNYHGRCFQLDGRFKSMPAFEDVENFPRPEDELAKISLHQEMGLLFGSLQPAIDWNKLFAPIRKRVDFLPLNTLVFDAKSSTNFEVKAHWALYIDNYLEGLHIPFVHPTLNEAIDFSNYKYELFPYANLQIGIAKENEPCFTLPTGHPDEGQRVYAYYFWIFPNMMFNFYPWGLSLNIIEARSSELTIVRFRSYLFEGTSFDRTVNAIEQTELEDEKVVENVQRGLKSRFYKTGRFSASMEPNVHHFHKLLSLIYSS